MRSLKLAVALFRDAYADVLTTAKWRNLECSNENSLKLLTKTRKYNDGADTSSHFMDVTDSYMHTYSGG